MNIDLVSIGDIHPGILQQLKDGLEVVFGCPVRIGESIEIPGDAFDRARDQYLSDTLLDRLRQYEHKSKHVLGVTEADIFTHGLNFVFGQADSVNRVALISLNQLRDEHTLEGGDKLLLERSLKEAVHELGHTLGLGHCEDVKCVMHFSNSLVDTDVKGLYFCSRCRPKLIE
ncbi:MAG: archaemetzincin family Zn-dependent metalloprotease [Dehalococcoidia bacterium]|nr:archaemetzincin family Zn-dependent metalloprotease [Dehalococcoidia bacterium]